jgi:hypothetical protein
VPLALFPQQQQAQPAHTPRTTSAPPTADHTTSLPVTRVALYKNGVGFFEHTGRVTGDAAVTIDLTSGQLNDVLQSLTAIDLNGGRISGAGYNSTTPLDQQLKTLPVSLDDNPTASDFYSAIRGARVEVRSGAASITGRLLSVEARSTKSDDNSNNTTNSTDRYFLTIVSDTGDTRTLELTPATSVRLLDASLHSDVSRYLQLIDANRSQGLRHLTLEDRGPKGSQTTRELRVSYISEVPIWKSTYRILFTNSNATSQQAGVPGGRSLSAGVEATLQGWSVVDNTTGADWTNVQLSLIAGAPQSFIQPLSQPIYSRRPEIPIAQEAQLSPQTHDSSLEALGNGPLSASQTVTVNGLASRARMSAGVAGMSGMPAGAPGGSGISTGAGGNIGGGLYHGIGEPVANYEALAENSVTPDAHTANFDDFFEYRINQPVTIRKNESALVPILQVKLPVESVTLVSAAGSSVSQPLRALWLTNNSGLTLDRGSFSIVEDGNFGGEGLLDPIHPDEKRLVSYAADQAVHVAAQDRRSGQHTTQISAAKGILRLHHTTSQEVTYVVHNAASTGRTVVLEYRLNPPFVFDDDSKPDETTATVARYRLTVPAGGTVKRYIGEHHRSVVTYELQRSNDSQLTYILEQSKDNPALLAALQPVLDARRKVADAQAAVDQTHARLKSLQEEEDRERANVTALKDADKSAGSRFIRDLNDTEDKLRATQAELDTRSASLDTAKANLSNAIETLEVDTGTKD